MKTKSKVVRRPEGEEMLDEGGFVGDVDDVGLGCSSPRTWDLESTLVDTSMDVDYSLDFSQSVCQGDVTCDLCGYYKYVISAVERYNDKRAWPVPYDTGP